MTTTYTAVCQHPTCRWHYGTATETDIRRIAAEHVRTKVTVVRVTLTDFGPRYKNVATYKPTRAAEYATTPAGRAEMGMES
jgi:predicted GNAT family acetyltransferase